MVILALEISCPQPNRLSMYIFFCDEMDKYIFLKLLIGYKSRNYKNFNGVTENYSKGKENHNVDWIITKEIENVEREGQRYDLER